MILCFRRKLRISLPHNYERKKVVTAMKNNMLKKLVSVSLSVLMITAAAGTGVSAASAGNAPTSAASVYRGFVTDMNSDGTIKITGYSGSAKSVRIPSMINGRQVTVIGRSAFEGLTNIDSVTLPNTITIIEDHAFKGCTSLKSILLPYKVSSVNGSAFMGCTSLQGIYADSNCKSFTSVKGVLFTKDTKTLVAYPAGRRGAYTVPSGVTLIGDHAFSENAALTSVNLPKGLKRIGFNSFDYCTELTRVRLNSDLQEIGTGGFNGCWKLSAITLPDSLTKIERNAFSGCRSLKAVTIPKNIKKLDFSLFEGCTSLRYVGLPIGLKEVYSNAFERCTSLVSVNLPSTVKHVYSLAFTDCKNLRNLTVRNKDAFLDPIAFGGCDALTIYGKKGSTAEAISKKLGIRFLSITAPGQSISDVTAENGRITVKARAVDGKAPYSYAVYYRSADSERLIPAQKFSSNKLIEIDVPKSGNYVVRVMVKDGFSRITHTDYTVKVD